MNELVVFGFGAVVFSMTTWAAIAFGLHRSHELHVHDLEKSGRTTEVQEDGLTELYVDLADDASVTPKP